MFSFAFSSAMMVAVLMPRLCEGDGLGIFRVDLLGVAVLGEVDLHAVDAGLPSVVAIGVLLTFLSTGW